MRIEPEHLDDGHDPLDAWLMQAEFPEPTSVSTARLQQRWRNLFGASRQSRRLAGSMIAAAAVVCVASAVGWVMLSRDAAPNSEITRAMPELPVPTVCLRPQKML